jgi:hypothetical protein
MPVFYGLYVADERLAAAFDLIRFLGEPNFVRRAHITVRGPYSQKLPTIVEGSWRGKRYGIYFREPGAFFSGAQRTVFLKCEIPGIEEIWDKPDYTGQITPHLTLYDGKDGYFGSRLLDTMKESMWSFVAESTELSVIHPKSTPASIKDFVVHQALYDEILERSVDYRAVRIMEPTQRLVYIKWVINFLQKEYIRKLSPDSAQRA